MTEPYGSPPYPVIGVRLAFGKVEEVIEYNMEEPPVFFEAVDNHGEYCNEFVGGMEIFLLSGAGNVLFKILEKLLDAVIKNFFFISEIDIQGSPGDAAAVGYFLKGCVFKAFVYKNIQGPFEYFLASFFMFNHYGHGLLLEMASILAQIHKNMNP
jgi:hypothetical protein